jgi:hypothetical protein
MMKLSNRLLIILGVALVNALAVGSTFLVNAQKSDAPPPPVIPLAHAEICGNVVVKAQAINEVIAALRAGGCTELRVEPLHDRHCLVFGTKLIVSDFP